MAHNVLLQDIPILVTTVMVVSVLRVCTQPAADFTNKLKSVFGLKSNTSDSWFSLSLSVKLTPGATILSSS